MKAFDGALRGSASGAASTLAENVLNPNKTSLTENLAHGMLMGGIMGAFNAGLEKKERIRKKLKIYLGKMRELLNEYFDLLELSEQVKNQSYHDNSGFDELAEKYDFDPVELKKMNTVSADEFQKTRQKKDLALFMNTFSEKLGLSFLRDFLKISSTDRGLIIDLYLEIDNNNYFPFTKNTKAWNEFANKYKIDFKELGDMDPVASKRYLETIYAEIQQKYKGNGLIEFVDSGSLLTEAKFKGWVNKKCGPTLKLYYSGPSPKAFVFDRYFKCIREGILIALKRRKMELDSGIQLPESAQQYNRNITSELRTMSAFAHCCANAEVISHAEASRFFEIEDDEDELIVTNETAEQIKSEMQNYRSVEEVGDAMDETHECQQEFKSNIKHRF